MFSYVALEEHVLDDRPWRAIAASPIERLSESRHALERCISRFRPALDSPGQLLRALLLQA